MAIQNGITYKPGGNASALRISVPTIIKSTAGTFWNINLLQVGTAPGYLYDWNSLVGLSETQVIAVLNPLAPLPPDLPGVGPFSFFNGLVFVPGQDGMIASIAYS